MSSPNIIFFCGRLLPLSETFVRAQGANLQAYTPHYVGTRFVQGLSLPLEQTLVINEGGMLGAIKEAAFKLSGIAPSFCQDVKALNSKLIHAHFGPCGALALPIAKHLEVPMIVTFYGLDATMKDDYARTNSISTWVYLQRRERLKREAKLFIAVSDFIKEKLLEQGFPAHKVLSHYYGVDTEAFQPDSLIAREPVVLFVGRLTEKKGCEYLLQAMSQVESMHPDAETVIIGDGPLRNELETSAKRLLRRCRFLGSQPSATVKQWMNKASVLVVPSVTASTGDSEGLPTVVVEAQAMGLPVVGSTHAGIPQAVLHEKTGFLAPERDWQTLTKHILCLLNEKNLWHDMSMNGRQHVQVNFDLRTQTKRLEEIYQSVLEQKN